MRITLLTYGLLITLNSWGQETIKGVVSDKQGVTPGVTVLEEGTDNKVTTNAKGEFEIKTKTSNPTLTFKFIGFETRAIKIGKKKTIKVKMKWEKTKGKHISMTPKTIYPQRTRVTSADKFEERAHLT